jgi:hypothetical protein
VRPLAVLLLLLQVACGVLPDDHALVRNTNRSLQRIRAGIDPERFVAAQAAELDQAAASARRLIDVEIAAGRRLLHADLARVLRLEVRPLPAPTDPERWTGDGPPPPPATWGKRVAERVWR